MKSDLGALCQRLDYTFQDIALLQRALTHRSFGAQNYERLEFLGDSILEFTISAELYHNYPELSEGKLTRLRATLVKKETLARLGRELGLGDYLLLGSGELKSGGYDRDSILADAMEAVFGAVYVDSDIERARQLVLNLYDEMLQEVTPDSVKKDPKTQLQEYLQQHSHLLPIYSTLRVEGKAHKQHFIVECVVPGLDDTVKGEGISRRKAEQQAASKALQLLSSE